MSKTTFKISAVRRLTSQLMYNLSFGQYASREEYVTNNLALSCAWVIRDLEAMLPDAPKDKRIAGDMVEAYRTIDRALISVVQWTLALTAWNEAPEALRADRGRNVSWRILPTLDRMAPDILDTVRRLGRAACTMAIDVQDAGADGVVGEVTPEELPPNCVPFRRKVA